MNVFQAARNVSPTELCERLHIKGRRTSTDRGRYLCPFHDDADPSMATYAAGRGYHCFACGAHGDVIDLAAKLMSLPIRDAAVKLCEMFQLDFDQSVREFHYPTEAPKEILVLQAFLKEWRQVKEDLAYNEWQHAEKDRECVDPDSWMWQLYHAKADHYRQQYHIYKAMTVNDVLDDLRKELVALDVIKERRIPVVGFVT